MDRWRFPRQFSWCADDLPGITGARGQLEPSWGSFPVVALQYRNKEVLLRTIVSEPKFIHVSSFIIIHLSYLRYLYLSTHTYTHTYIYIYILYVYVRYIYIYGWFYISGLKNQDYEPLANWDDPQVLWFRWTCDVVVCDRFFLPGWHLSFKRWGIWWDEHKTLQFCWF